MQNGGYNLLSEKARYLLDDGVTCHNMGPESLLAAPAVVHM